MSVTPSVDVLVVEDDRALRQLLVRVLRDAHLTADEATDIAEAKRFLGHQSYAVLVLDLLLPDGTGFSVLEFIKSAKMRRPHIVVITAADASLLKRLDRAIVKTVMFKPIQLDHFVTTVHALAVDQSTRPS